MSATCGPGGEHVLYGWGKNAPAIHLPRDTGFAVGPGAGIRVVVLQVHFLQVRAADDASGVRLRLTTVPQQLSAGLIAFAAGFAIPPGQASHLVENECCYSGWEELRGFAFRVHTHGLGRNVYLDQGGPREGRRAGAPLPAHRAAEMDPQRPQGFYPIDPYVVIRPGDRLRTTCDFNSTEVAEAVTAGHTAAHEMCNLYLMLYGELPYFMWCVDNGEWIEPAGPGGVGDAAEGVPEQRFWAPKHTIDSVSLPALEEGGGGGEEAAGAEDADGGAAPAAAAGAAVKMQVGQVAGVDLGPNGTMWAFHRAFRTWTETSFGADGRYTKGPLRWPAVLRLDRHSGAYVASMGAGMFYMPHMVTGTSEGDVWVVDTGAHTATLLSGADGTVKTVLGQTLEPGNSTEPLRFCQPTHAVVSRDGHVYIADGYCNSRVVVVTPKGKVRDVWKLPRKKDSPDPLPHSLALDECRGRLYVADREVGRVWALSLETGESLGFWDVGKRYGLPYAVRVGPYASPMVLVWDRERSGVARLVVLSPAIGDIAAGFDLEGVNSPHDFAVMAAPVELTGAGERAVAVVVAETAPRGSRLRKFVLIRKEAVEEGALGDVDQPAGLAASHSGHTMLKPVDEGAAGGADDEDDEEEVQDEKEVEEEAVEEEKEVKAHAEEKKEVKAEPPAVTQDDKEENAAVAASVAAVERAAEADGDEAEDPDDYAALPRDPLEDPGADDYAGAGEERERESAGGGTKAGRSGEDEDAEKEERFSRAEARARARDAEAGDGDGSLLGVVVAFVAGSPLVAVVSVVAVGVAVKVVASRVAAVRARARGYRSVDHLA